MAALALVSLTATVNATFPCASATDPSVLISPTNLAFDSKGNLYILEGGYVRMVSTAAPHTITTVVGNGKPYTDSGTRGFNCAVVGDGGLATSAELNAIDIAFDAADRQPEVLHPRCENMDKDASGFLDIEALHLRLVLHERWSPPRFWRHSRGHCAEGNSTRRLEKARFEAF